MTKSRDLTVCLERLRSLRFHFGGVGGVSAEVVEDFNSIMEELVDAAPEFARLKLAVTSKEQIRAGLSSFTGNREVFPRELFSARVGQALAVLDALVGRQPFIEPRATASPLAVEDSELNSRAVSLLDKGEHFDRAVNQATQVLEVRIKTISG